MIMGYRNMSVIVHNESRYMPAITEYRMNEPTECNAEKMREAPVLPKTNKQENKPQERISCERISTTF